MKTLIDLFVSSSQFNNRPACIHRTEYRRFVYTYDDISRRSIRVANLLKDRGLQAGDPVLLWAPNGPEWVTAYWGILLAGGVVVPVDLMALPSAVQKVQELTRAKLAIKTLYKPSLEGCEVLGLEQLGDLSRRFSDEKDSFDFPTPSPDDIAEIIYTSGTTGDPKGVVMRHKNLMTNVRQLSEHVAIQKEWKFLSLLPLSHLFEQTGGFLLPYAHGCQVVYMKTIKPTNIFAALEHEKVHVVMSVPRLLKAMQQGITAKLEKKHLGKIFARLRKKAHTKPFATRKKYFRPIHRPFGSQFQFFVSGGSALGEELETWWSDLGFAVLQGYGLSECSPVLCANTPNNLAAGTVGTPVPGVQIRLSSDGEIQAKGANIFDGYFENEKKTREVFTDDGWFRTGDVGAFDTRGNLAIKGRIKDMIVTEAGVNVYPEDIEAALLAQSGVMDATVVEQSSAPFAVLIFSGDTSGDQVVKAANAELNSAQQVVGWKVWDSGEFPKTTTMKVKKNEIRAWLGSQEGHQVAAVAGKQQKLYHLIHHVTGVSVSQLTLDTKVSSDLKLSSIDRLELASLIESEFYFEVDETAIGPDTTIADLEEMISKRKGKSTKKFFREWQHTGLFKIWRRFVHWIFIKPFVNYYCNPKVFGLSNFDHYKAPVIFAPNHVSFLDHPSILTMMPDAYRFNTMSAARSEFFDEWSNPVERFLKGFCFEFCIMIMNVFPLSQEGAFKSSLLHAGRMADRGYNILLFPEGSRSWDGVMLDFHQGVSVLARELSIPVVPVHVRGFQEVFPRGANWPKRGNVTIHFGKPLNYRQGEQLTDFTNRLKQAILDL